MKREGPGNRQTMDTYRDCSNRVIGPMSPVTNFHRCGNHLESHESLLTPNRMLVYFAQSRRNFEVLGVVHAGDYPVAQNVCRHLVRPMLTRLA